MIMWLYDWEPLKLGLHGANFGSFMHCGSEDKMFKGLCDIIYDI